MDLLWKQRGYAYKERLVVGKLDWSLQDHTKDSIYFMFAVEEMYSYGSVSITFHEPKCVYSSTWSNMYYYGLNSDRLRIQCHKYHDFV